VASLSQRRVTVRIKVFSVVIPAHPCESSDRKPHDVSTALETVSSDGLRYFSSWKGGPCVHVRQHMVHETTLAVINIPSVLRAVSESLTPGNSSLEWSEGLYRSSSLRVSHLSRVAWHSIGHHDWPTGSC
jgi:hypothetical protein